MNRNNKDIFQENLLEIQAEAESLGIETKTGFPENSNIKKLCADIPVSFFIRYKIFPFDEKGEIIRVAVCDLSTIRPLEYLGTSLRRDIQPVLMSRELILEAINGFEQDTLDESKEVIKDIGKTSGSSILLSSAQRNDLLDIASQPPIIKLVNIILFEAIKARATDIHIQPEGETISVRYRVDGVLNEALTPPIESHNAIISRIKVMAGMNVTERRLPQDGRISFHLGVRQIEVRVSIIPTIHGERVVMRILDKDNLLLQLEELGMQDYVISFIKQLILRPNGLLFIAGPTGSGKTTTLYAALSKISHTDRNIVTIEEPVEYRLDGLSQIQVKPDIGMTFAAGLRSVLRQDPDVVMVGEVRDSETARIAVQASITGHLVLSTVHTATAVEALSRLFDLGVERYMVQSSISGVIAQRLVRTNCKHCLEKTKPSLALLKEIGWEEGMNAEFMKGKGCPECLGTGYKGRTGIFEGLIIDDKVRSAISETLGIKEITTILNKRNYSDLKMSGLEKVCTGQTTVDEVLRVL
ncbi:MAG: ATPase, T2SS/T4P/T4SS family [Candidatus Theseobacter exili]|nr:ATPase, T2SS/T4P/T4SS family [Candidatus Theseobacter exili]